MVTHFDTVLLDRRISDARRGCGDSAYDLGVAYSTGTAGAAFDLVEAHKWFNLAAARGVEAALTARAEIAEDMTAREIATAQRAARDLLAGIQRRAA